MQNHPVSKTILSSGKQVEEVNNDPQDLYAALGVIFFTIFSPLAFGTRSRIVKLSKLINDLG
jgi:hypothetical protein